MIFMGKSMVSWYVIYVPGMLLASEDRRNSTLWSILLSKSAGVIQSLTTVSQQWMEGVVCFPEDGGVPTIDCKFEWIWWSNRGNITHFQALPNGFVFPSHEGRLSMPNPPEIIYRMWYNICIQYWTPLPSRLYPQVSDVWILKCCSLYQPWWILIILVLFSSILIQNLNLRLEAFSYFSWFLASWLVNIVVSRPHWGGPTLSASKVCQAALPVLAMSRRTGGHGGHPGRSATASCI